MRECSADRVLRGPFRPPGRARGLTIGSTLASSAVASSPAAARPVTCRPGSPASVDGGRSAGGGAPEIALQERLGSTRSRPLAARAPEGTVSREADGCLCCGSPPDRSETSRSSAPCPRSPSPRGCLGTEMSSDTSAAVFHRRYGGIRRSPAAGCRPLGPRGRSCSVSRLARLTLWRPGGMRPRWRASRQPCGGARSLTRHALGIDGDSISSGYGPAHRPRRPRSEDRARRVQLVASGRGLGRRTRRADPALRLALSRSLRLATACSNPTTSGSRARIASASRYSAK